MVKNRMTTSIANITAFINSCQGASPTIVFHTTSVNPGEKASNILILLRKYVTP